MSSLSLSSSKRTQLEFVKNMSTLEKMAVTPKTLLALTHAIASLFTTMIYSKDSKPTQKLRFHYYTMVRTLGRLLTPAQFQVFAPPTDDVYESACKKYGQKPDSLVLEDGTRAHWVGPSDASKIIVNFHGGGYVIPAGPGWLEYMFLLQRALSTPELPVAVLFLSYDTAPARTYPRQLQQAAMLMSHILHVMHKDPADLILTGDSAGANLCLALLSHIAHPHPSKDTPIIPISMPEGKKFCGVVLLSPWVDFRLDRESFTRNRVKDCLDLEAGQAWSQAFMGTHPASPGAPYPNADFYNQPITAPVSWWEPLGDFVETILVVAGRDEVLIDGIEEFAGQLKQVASLKGKVTLVVTEEEGHDQPMMDLGINITTEGAQMKTVKEWMKSKL